MRWGVVKTGHGCYNINRVVNVGITEVRLEQRLEVSGDSTGTIFHTICNISSERYLEYAELKNV